MRVPATRATPSASSRSGTGGASNCNSVMASAPKPRQLRSSLPGPDDDINRQCAASGRPRLAVRRRRGPYRSLEEAEGAADRDRTRSAQASTVGRFGGEVSVAGCDPACIPPLSGSRSHGVHAERSVAQRGSPQAHDYRRSRSPPLRGTEIAPPGNPIERYRGFSGRCCPRLLRCRLADRLGHCRSGCPGLASICGCDSRCGTGVGRRCEDAG